MILRRQKRRLMMIEPPGDPRRRRIFEVDNRVLIAAEFALVKQRAGAMHQPVILIPGVAVDALPMEAREQRSRAGSVKAFVVIEDANQQTCSPG